MDTWPLDTRSNDPGRAMRDLMAHEAYHATNLRAASFKTPNAGTAPLPPARTSARQEILDAIEQFPGIHKTALCKEVGLAWGTICYHIDSLVKSGLVSAMTTGREMHLFPPTVAPERMRWLTALRSDVARMLVEILRRRPEATIQDFSNLTGASRKVVGRQIAKLQEAGLVINKGTRRPRFSLDPAAWYVVKRDGLMDPNT